MTRKHKPKRRNPNAPTGYPTPADAEHTARVEAAKARREAEAAERRRQWREREAAKPVEQRVSEELGGRRARWAITMATVLGGVGITVSVKPVLPRKFS